MAGTACTGILADGAQLQACCRSGGPFEIGRTCQIVFVSVPCCGPASVRLAVDTRRMVPSPQPTARRCGSAGSTDSACAWPPSPPSVQSTCPRAGHDRVRHAVHGVEMTLGYDSEGKCDFGKKYR